MEKFYVVENKALAAQIAGRIKTSEKERFQYWNILFNCVERTYEHADVSWVNKAIPMAKAVGRYRATVAILREVIPYAFDKEAQIFHGKRQAGKFAALGGTYGLVLAQLIEDQREADNAPPSKTAKTWEYEVALANFLKTCGKHDITPVKVAKDIEKAVKASEPKIKAAA